MTALDQLTPIQREALEATAVAHLRDPEELAAAFLPLLLITPEEWDAGATDDETAGVNAPLTPATEPDFPEATTYAVTFTTAPTQEIPRS